ncbi:hypothetical protein [Paenibacillus xylanexedens]|uniref:hypothetical protein n=1 Tax=Paenibacillus xylanexedens TaxID=528191 RepID=UPI001643AEE6|nr:hypothetical protein [Paenibacillus xylanexedens]
MPTPTESLTAAFYNCKERNCSKEQLEGFLDRARTQFACNEGMQSIIAHLQDQI